MATMAGLRTWRLVNGDPRQGVFLVDGEREFFLGFPHQYATGAAFGSEDDATCTFRFRDGEVTLLQRNQLP